MAEYAGMLKHQKELLLEYGKKLNIEKDMITDVYFPTLEQVDQISKEKIEPLAQQWDEEGTTLKDGKVKLPGNLEEVYNLFCKDKKGPRLYEALIPEEFDGVGFPSLVVAPIMETINYYDMSFAVTIGLGTTLIEAIALHPTEYLVQKYIPLLMDGEPGYVGFTEAGAGSNLRNIKTTSELTDGYYHIKGTKIFISNAGFANLGIILARNIVNGKEEGTNAFIVENTMQNPDDASLPGIQCTRIEEKLGLHANPTGVLEINCLVPKENILGPPGKGYRTTLERLIGMRMGVAGQATALAERAYQYAKTYAEERIQFNKPIISFPGVSNKLKGMEIEIQKMRRFHIEAAFVISKYQKKSPIRTKYLSLTKNDEKSLTEFASQLNWAVLHHTISKAKVYNSEVGWFIVDDSLQIFGGNGFIKDYQLERLLRDFRILRIYEGTSEIHEVTLNRTNGIVTAENMDTLMNIAINAPSAKTAAPEPIPTDYQEIFFKKFPSTMETFMDEDGDPRYLFNN